MNVKKFKLGDKVRITKEECRRELVGKIGTITQVDRIKNGFSANRDYEVRLDDSVDCVFSPEEMERAFKKGEQLLFEFMA